MLLGILGWRTSLPFLLRPLIHSFRFFWHDLNVFPPQTWSMCQTLVKIYVDFLIILGQGPWPKNVLESFTPTIYIQYKFVMSFNYHDNLL